MMPSTIKQNEWEIAGIEDRVKDSSARELIRSWINGVQEFSFQTSGSTGVPKTVTFHRAQITASIQRTLTAIEGKTSDHFLCTLSPSSIAGAMTILRAAFCKATLTVMSPSSNPLSMIDEGHPYTIVSFVPMQLFGELDFEKFNRFKVVLIGGAAILPALEEKLSHCTNQVFETYGMTETISHMALRRIGIENNFKVLSGIEIKTNDNGCLQIKGDITNNVWLTTNDLIEQVDNNHFVYLGRADQMINSGGVKVNPVKVETALQARLSNLNYFVAGSIDEKLGEAVTLFIEGDERPIALDLNSLDIGMFEKPRKVVYVKKFFRTSSGKIDKVRTLASIVT